MKLERPEGVWDRLAGFSVHCNSSRSCRQTGRVAEGWTGGGKDSPHRPPAGCADCSGISIFFG